MERWTPPFDESDTDAWAAAAGVFIGQLAAVTRQLDMVKVYITDPVCREITERKINDALAVLKAAGVEVEG